MLEDKMQMGERYLTQHFNLLGARRDGWRRSACAESLTRLGTPAGQGVGWDRTERDWLKTRKAYPDPLFALTTCGLAERGSLLPGEAEPEELWNGAHSDTAEVSNGGPILTSEELNNILHDEPSTIPLLESQNTGSRA